ncbi:hypothetical protein BO70DRAFT_409191, partial [Aspergillus heteromorphus CBS 117.55]
GVSLWPGASCAPSRVKPTYNAAPPGALGGVPGSARASPAGTRYLVDSASSHMLVSKIKPCMSKYKHFIP